MIDAPKLPTHLTPLTSATLESGLALENAEVGHLDWSGGELRRLSLDAVRLVAPQWLGTKLRDGAWADVLIEGGALAGAELAGTTLRRVEFRRVRADGLVVSETRAGHIRLIDTKLDLANFRFAQWSKVRFEGCSLREVEFIGAELSQVEFVNCELIGCNFAGAKLTQVDFRSSRLDECTGTAGLRGATLDQTQLISLAPSLAAELGIIVVD